MNVLHRFPTWERFPPIVDPNAKSDAKSDAKFDAISGAKSDAKASSKAPDADLSDISSDSNSEERPDADNDGIADVDVDPKCPRYVSLKMELTLLNNVDQCWFANMANNEKLSSNGLLTIRPSKKEGFRTWRGVDRMLRRPFTCNWSRVSETSATFWYPRQMAAAAVSMENRGIRVVQNVTRFYSILQTTWFTFFFWKNRVYKNVKLRLTENSMYIVDNAKLQFLEKKSFFIFDYSFLNS